jgi:hypothetical protein
VRTSDLIDRLVEDAKPVRRLPHPAIRAATWLCAALPFVTLVVLVMSPRPDLAAKLTETRFLIEQAAAFATAIAAAIAAFTFSVPGIDRRWALLPAAPLGLWVASLAAGCVADWLNFGAEGLRLTPDLACFPSIALVGAAPAIAIVVMLRRGAPLAPFLTMALAGLAAAALGNFGLRFFHAQDAGLMVLVWQFGSVGLLAALVGVFGRHFVHLPRGRWA